jgi:sugar transferase (PEP-CTERM system associated)
VDVVVKILRPYLSSPLVFLGLLDASVAVLVLYVATCWLSAPDRAGYLAVALGPGLLAAGLVFGRLVAAPFTRKRFPKHRILVVGTGRLAAEIEALLSRRGNTRTEVIGYLALDGEPVDVPQSRITSDIGSLLGIARANGVDEVVVALEDRRGMPLKPLLEARMEGISITSYLSFWERETGRLNLAALDPSWLIYADGFRIATATNAALKRGLDVALSLALLILTLPTLIFAALAIRFHNDGPIFYRQLRVGRGGRSFDIYKFRTMRVDAETRLGPQWAVQDDARVTRVGRFLRRTRIDELPQILNVLKGEMSFVGPRPERPFFVERLAADIPFYAERHRVRPGITGWAQVKHPYGASIEDARGKLSYDLYYIKNFSFLFDLHIILRTVQAVLVGTGAR